MSRCPCRVNTPKQRYFTLPACGLGCLVVVMLVSGCSRALDPAVLQDAQLAVRVRTALVNDREIGVLPIEVTVRLGVVTLTGRVATEAQVKRATEQARSVPGVRDVTSALRVDPAAAAPTTAPTSPSASDRGLGDAELLDTNSPRPGLIAIGGSVSRSVPGGRELQSALGIGPLVRLGSGQGLGVAIGFSWFSTDLESADAPGRPGTLKIRPVMGGLAYTAQRGRSAASFSVVGGWAFNGLDTDLRSAGSVLAVDVENSLAARTGVSVWIDVSHRSAFNTFVGYLITRPRVAFLEGDRFETRTVPADVLLVSAGLVYKLF